MNTKPIVMLIFILFVSALHANSYALPDVVVSPINSDRSKIKSPEVFNALALPFGFIPNAGQLDQRVAFYSKIDEGIVYVLSTGELVYDIFSITEGRRNGVVLRERCSCIQNGDFKGSRWHDTKVSYFKGSDSGKWRSGLSCYREIECIDYIDGISMKLVSTQGLYEKIISVDPDIDVEDIRITIDGAESLVVDNEGNLECVTGHGSVLLSKPVAYQLIDDAKIYIDAEYTLAGNTYGFRVGNYNKGFPLHIDPLISSTMFGGTNNDSCYAIHVSNEKTVYVAGQTGSSDLPTTIGSYETSYNGGSSDIFVSRLDANLTKLMSSTFVGGTGSEGIVSQKQVIFDDSGNLWLCSNTTSTDFPTTEGVYDTSFNGDVDAVIFKMDHELTTLSTSTYLGGDREDGIRSLAIDEQGRIYVSGMCFGGTFPTTKGAYDTTHNSSWDIFVSCFDAELSTLIASTFVGGNLAERPEFIHHDGKGAIYIAGKTNSPDYPTTSGAYDETFNDAGYGNDNCISKLDDSLTTLLASTFIGGGYIDQCEDAVIDGDTIVLTGYTTSVDYPTTLGVISNKVQGASDIFASRLSLDLDELIASTLIGGESNEFGQAMAICDSGYVFIGGRTPGDIPFQTTPGAFDPDVNLDDEDGFIVRINHDFTRYTAATILGGGSSADGGNDEVIEAIDVTDDGQVYVCGKTRASDFPTTTGALFQGPLGGYDGFISVLDELLTLHAGKIIVSPGRGYENPPSVRVYPAAQDAIYGFEFDAYGPRHYGANVCCGSLDDDESDEIITGAGPGDIYGPHVRGFEIDGHAMPGLSFLAYGTNKYGVNIAAGDIDGDGYDEIVTGAGPGAVFGPHVRAFDYDGSPGITAVPGVSYFAYGTPKWGVNVATGDIDGDGFAEIITGAGPGAVYGPHVRGWDVDGGAVSPMADVSYFAYGTLKYGVNVTSGDVDGDGIAEIVTGAGPGLVFGAHVRGWNHDGSGVSPLPGFSFFAWPPAEARYGVKVYAGADLDGDGRAELVAGAGPDSEMGSLVRVYRYNENQINEWFNIEAFPGLTHGTCVAAGRF